MKWITHQFIRGLHVSICFCVMLPLLLRPSVLHRMVIKRENIAHGCLYLVFFVAAICAYFIASYTDPGYLTYEKARLFRHRRGNSSECGDRSLENDTSQFITLALSDSKSSNDPTDEEFHMVSNTWLDFSRLFQWLTYPFSSLCGENLTFEDPITYNLSIPVRQCRHCLLEQPLRCRHCPDCNRCVIKFDHHCPWIANCVGERNHSSFVTFLALQTLVIWWTLYLAGSSVVPNYRWLDWFRSNGLVLAELFILSLTGIPLTGLLVFHIYLALANRTTWETVSHERIVYLQHLDDRTNPFNQGCVRNCYSFCCSPFPFGWDRIYAEAVEKQTKSAPVTSADPAQHPMRTGQATCSIAEDESLKNPVFICQQTDLLPVIPNTPKDSPLTSGIEPVNI